MTSVHTHKQGYYNINRIFLVGGKEAIFSGVSGFYGPS